MKKNFAAWGALFTALMIALSGCGAKKEETGSGVPGDDPVGESSSSGQEENFAVSTAPEQETETFDMEPYRDILDGLWLTVGGHISLDQAPDGAMGVQEAAAVFGPDAADQIGFCLKDVSGDGIPELLVGAVDDGVPSFESILYAVYTLAENEPYCTLSGWDRNAYYLAGNGFFYNGSGGAVYSTFGSYILSGDGRFPICTDYYFSKEKSDDFKEIGYYHNITGFWDPDGSEELDGDTFWMKQDELAGGIISAELTPFSAYKFTGEIPEEPPEEPIPAPGPVVTIRAAEDQLQFYPDYVSFYADVSEFSTEVLLTAENETVSDLRVYALEFTDAYDNMVYFAVEELFYLAELRVDCPLLLSVSFPGTIPAYGISYTGAEGETVWRTLNISGMDGSFFLNVFAPAE